MTFSSNGLNSSKQTTATLGQAGTYTFLATAQFPGGFSATSTVTVTITAKLTSISVSPANLSLNANTPQQFTALGFDQFGNALPASVGWTAAGGSISSGGLFTSGATSGGFSVTATSGSVVGSTNVTILNSPATIATAASASPSPATGTTTNLSALAVGDTGQYTYTWSTQSQPAVSVTPIFSLNGTNAAQQTIVTFGTAGTYTFLATIRNSGVTIATSSVTVIVNQTLTKITVSPTPASVNEDSTKSFTAAATDQFGNSDSVSLNWTATTGTILANGLFTSGVSTGGFTVTAASGSVSGSAAVTVSNAAPTVASPASASPSPVLTNFTNLNVLGADDGGESNLTYTWSVTSKPTSATTPTFAINGTNAAKSNVVTFYLQGSYTFLVTITDAGGLSTTSSVSLTVTQTAATITISPTTVSVNESASQQFTGAAYDQFGVAMTASFSWTVNSGGAGGTINSSGLYTAPGIIGTDTVKLSTGSADPVYATVTVISSSLGIFTAAQDIGAPALAGSSGYDTSTGVYSVSGAGTDISGAADQFQFCYESLTGDGTITADVTSITDTNGSAKSGVMFRNTLDAGGIDLLLAVTPTGGIKLEGRDTDGGTAVIDDTDAGLTAPYWVRLTRIGNNFTGYISPDGSTWTTLGSVTVPMNTSIYVGLAVSSHDTTALNTSTFQNVSVVPLPYIVTPAAGNPTTVTETQTQLSALANENGSAANLIYNWSATGPAAVNFTANGTPVAANTTATFTRAGSYTFTVTVTDDSDLTTASSVNITVDQTLTSITVTPGSPLVPNGQTQSFSAAGVDQFADPVSAPAVTWSLDNGSVGSFNSSTAVYTAPSTGVGSATVRATSGSVSSMATVTVQLTTIVGTSGNDIIRLVSNSSTLSVFINNPSTAAYSTPLSSLGTLTVLGEGGSDQIVFDSSAGGSPVPAAGLTINAANGSAQLSFVGSSNSDSLTLAAGAITIPAPSAGAGIVPITLNSLTISSTVTLALSSTAAQSDRNVLVLSAFANSGLMDLGENDMIVHGGNAAAITNQIVQGYAAGKWTGSTGITSSAAAANGNTALGVELDSNGSEALLNTFDGQNVGSADVLIKYTYYGDANLDGVVNGSDYTLIDNGFNNGRTGWHNGDFNYDGVVNGDDYTLIDNAFNTQASPLAAQNISRIVPTPGAANNAAATHSAAPPIAVTIAKDTSDKKKKERLITSIEDLLNAS